MLRFSFYFLLFCFAIGIAVVGGVLWYVVPDLPSADELSEVHLQTPLRVFSADRKLIAEFGEKRRQPVAIDDVPILMKQAFIAAEDDRFYYHPGVDLIAIARAAIELLQTREKRQGGSTITMQVARNFFLTREKTYERKLKEIVLAIRIERELSKDQILELYVNKIFLGHRAYGVAAAAQVYYGSKLRDLSVAQIAMIAGLPKAPSNTNPVTNPQAAETRRAYVLSRMHTLGYIDQFTYERALREPLTASIHGLATETSAEYVAEMVRAYVQEHYADDAYTAGYQVYTTVDSKLQNEGNRALRKALIDFSRRHGYRGPEQRIDISELSDDEISHVLDSYVDIGGLPSALVLAVDEKTATVLLRSGNTLELPWYGLNWARKFISQDARGAAPKSAADVVAVGDIIRVQWIAPISADELKEKEKKGSANEYHRTGYWRLAQIPKVEGALVSINSATGAIESLVGGFDFKKSKYNRVTQALRQPGSNFKPFIYSAALEHGFTAASFINDAPIVFEAPGLEAAWRPENYSGKYFGPTRLRVALTKSRNLISIRLLRAIGINNAITHAEKFGIDVSRLPRNLSLSLGSGEITPMELATAYTVLSNGGFRIEPHFISRIEDKNGQLIMQANPLVVCEQCLIDIANNEASTSLGTDSYEDDGLSNTEGLPLLLDTPVLSDATTSAPDNDQQVPEPRYAPRVLNAENAWIMNSILRDVITAGTGRRALSLKRKDLAGKTGTTNDQKDAWFSGFNGDVVTTAWVGFDNSRPLGRRETGARAALPMWIEYMGAALANRSESMMQQPPGLVTVRIDPATGLLAGINHPNAIFESFREDKVPARGNSIRTPNQGGQSQDEVEQLF